MFYCTFSVLLDIKKWYKLILSFLGNSFVEEGTGENAEKEFPSALRVAWATAESLCRAARNVSGVWRVTNRDTRTFQWPATTFTEHSCRSLFTRSPFTAYGDINCAWSGSVLLAVHSEQSVSIQGHFFFLESTGNNNVSHIAHLQGCTSP